MAGGKRQAAGATRQRRSTTADTATLEDRCHPRKIFIGGLASDTTTQDLRDYFGQFGSIVDAVVLRWPDGRSRGFGYVTFADAYSSSALLAGTHTVGGQEVDVKRAVPGTNKLFVGGLPQNTMAAELREHFEAFGVVSDAVVMIDPATGRSRGFGFVCFAPGQEGAAAVTAALDQYRSHRIRGKWIEVKSAAPPHKFVSHDTAEAATPPGLSPTGTPPPCTTPPPALGYLALGAQTFAEGYDPAPLPKLLGPAGWADPQKVLLPPGVAAPIGTPPGLDHAGFGAADCGQAALGDAAARAQRGAINAIPRPSTSSAAAAQQSMWWSGGPLGPGCAAYPVATARPLAQPPGRFGSTTPDIAPPQQTGAGAQGDLSTALQRSLEELLRLKMRGAEEGLDSPEQLSVA
jgi:RNA-binding protein Musashi